MTAGIALGTAQLGMAYGVANRRGMLEEAQAGRILHTAVELGVKVWDTAPVYGSAEARIGSFLRRYGPPDGLRLFTKLSRLPETLSSEEVERHVLGSVDASRATLGTDRLAGLLLHDCRDLERHGTALVDALGLCRERGWVELVGASVYAASEIEALSVEPSMKVVQYPFNLFSTGASAGAARVRARGWSVFARSSLVQGAIALDPEEVAPAFAPWLRQAHRLCAGHEAPLVEAALGFALEHSGADYVVLGVEDPSQLVAASRIRRRVDRIELYAAFRRELAGGSVAADPRTWTIAD